MPSSSRTKRKSSKTKQSGNIGAGSSAIKGGGRASLSSEAQDIIVDLLMELRDEKNPLLPKQRPASTNDNDANVNNNNNDEDDDDDGSETATSSTMSDHERKRCRKKFMKRLVECHRREELALKFNQQSLVNDNRKNNEENQQGGSVSLVDSTQSAAVENKAAAEERASSEEVVEGRVRLELVEAVYSISSSGSKKSKDKKSLSSSSTSSSKSKSNKLSSNHHHQQQTEWKEGSVRKTLVLPRSTSIKDLLSQSKSKLRTKKKPTRCFYVDKETKMEMDLTHDLRGIVDGDTLYVATTDDEKKKLKEKNRMESGEAESDDKDDDDEKEGNDIQDDVLEFTDPLEAVKMAYVERRRWKRMKRWNRVSHDEPAINTLFQEPRRDMSSPSPSPPFSDHFDKLPPLPSIRAELPAAKYREEILKSLDSSRVLVICGATGCGKSTQVPQYLLEGMAAIGRKSDANILVTQPRRVAATSLAERVATERSTPPPGKRGSEVGYNVRLSRAIVDSTRIVYCTVGILLRMLVNPMEQVDDMITAAADSDNVNNGNNDETKTRDSPAPLSTLSHVVIDEVHERDINTDFVLTLLRPLLAVNKNIKIILMSATSSPELFVKYFRSSQLGIEPKVLSIPGRTFPVTTNWLSDCERFAGRAMSGWVAHSRNDSWGDQHENENDASNANNPAITLSPRATARIDDAFMCSLVSAIVRDQKEKGKLSTVGKPAFREDGAILIFLPGKGEIESLARCLKDNPPLGKNSLFSVLPLHSTLPQSQQRAVFEPAKAGTVKIVLATNVAETSITIPDVSSVIDTGRVKESRFNPSTRIGELVTVWTSRASATQRAGRAGRTGPGTCWKLYTEEFSEKQMPARTSPEIFRTPLDELVLQICLLDEQRRDRSSATSSLQVVGTSPVKFLSQAPEPPPIRRLLHACKHLVEIGAITLVAKEPELLFRLTPLGYHLAHLPMNVNVAKVLIVGCVLECVEPALTIAAFLSHPKTCWFPQVAGPDGKQKARQLQEELIRDGFGGPGWSCGTAKGDLIAVIAAYDAWESKSTDRERFDFAVANALHHNVLREMQSLRSQFKESLIDAGFLDSKSKQSSCSNDALLTCCCLVAGLYPNVASLVRPKRGKGNFRGGRLITKDCDLCRPSSNSFQVERVRNASETGKDAYVVFHGKHRSLGVESANAARQKESFLSEVSFISRYALLLFGGEMEVRDNAIILDGWLKFKVGFDGQASAVLIQELRKELDNVMLKHIAQEQGVASGVVEAECKQVMQVVHKLLEEE